MPKSFLGGTMEKCYFSKKHKHERLIGACATLFVCCGMYSFGFYFLITNDDPAVQSISLLLVFLGVAITIWGILYDMFVSREFSINEQGIIMRYWCGKMHFYPWEQICQICLCVIHQGKVESVRDEVIWCTAGRIRKGPPNMARRWNESEYCFLHYRTVLTFELTPERLSTFQKYSNRNIPDYRGVIYR